MNDTFLPHAPLSLITPSPTNPRKRFDEKALSELAESIRNQGLLQPVLVREHPTLTGWELVAGERRYRAAKLAGLDTIPAIVRDLTDSQVLEAQLLENAQRQDVLPLEEAEAIERCLAGKVYGEKAEAIPVLAAKLGKSERWIYQRLSLLNLTDEAKTELLDGNISLSHAVEIAPLKPEVQERAITQLLYRTSWDGERHVRGERAEAVADMPVRNLRAELRRGGAMIELNTARFDRDLASLFPRAGACEACPKRNVEGNQCLDVKCFEAKTNIRDEQCIEAARQEHPDAWLVSLSWSSKRKDLKIVHEDFRCHLDDGPQTAIVVEGSASTPPGSVIQITPTAKGSPAAKAEAKAEKEEGVRQRKAEHHFRKAVVTAATNEIAGWSASTALRHALAVTVAAHYDGPKRLARALEFAEHHAEFRSIDELPLGVLIRALLIWPVLDNLRPLGQYDGLATPDGITALGEAAEIDLAMIRREAEQKFPKKKPAQTSAKGKDRMTAGEPGAS